MAIQAILEGRAPVTCVCSGLKRGVNELGRLVDNYGELMVTTFLILVIVPLVTWISLLVMQ